MTAQSNAKVWKVDPDSMELLDKQCDLLMLSIEDRTDIYGVIAEIVDQIEAGTYSRRISSYLYEELYHDWIVDSVTVPGGRIGFDAIEGVISFEFHKSDLPDDPVDPDSDQAPPPNAPGPHSPGSGFSRGVSVAIRALHGGGFGNGAFTSKLILERRSHRSSVLSSIVLSTPTLPRLVGSAWLHILVIAIGAVIAKLARFVSGTRQPLAGWSANNDLHQLTVRLEARFVGLVGDMGLSAKLPPQVMAVLAALDTDIAQMNVKLRTETYAKKVDHLLAVQLANALLRYPWMLLASLRFVEHAITVQTKAVSWKTWADFLIHSNIGIADVLGHDGDAGSKAERMSQTYEAARDNTAITDTGSGPTMSVVDANNLELENIAVCGMIDDSPQEPMPAHDRSMLPIFGTGAAIPNGEDRMDGVDDPKCEGCEGAAVGSAAWLTLRWVQELHQQEEKFTLPVAQDGVSLCALLPIAVAQVAPVAGMILS